MVAEIRDVSQRPFALRARRIGQRIAQAAQMACLLEVSAPKPGNVSRRADFADTRFDDFLLSAVAIGPAMERTGDAPVGRTIWRAIRHTQKVVHTNTNLGLVLMLAPLAKACCRALLIVRGEAALSESNVRACLGEILRSLTVEDARWTYAAIRLAQAGGLGRVAEADVSEDPSITLYHAMELARDRDSIAREYVSEYEITFSIGYPALADAWQASDPPMAIVQAFLTILAQVPDTLIARKRGPAVARQVSAWAQEALALGGVLSAKGRRRLAELEQALHDLGHTLNPGTTADLTTAAIFLLLLRGR